MSAGPGATPGAKEGPAVAEDGLARRRELFRQALAGKAARRGGGFDAAGAVPARDGVAAPCGSRPLPLQGRSGGKGIGPNKASGHKGGMGRQGSKRG